MSELPETSRRLLREIADFRDGRQSLLLATVDALGTPQASVTPYVSSDDGHIYIYVSALSRHTLNLSDTNQASILFTEDEQDTNNMFARKRLSYFCHCKIVKSESRRWEDILSLFETRFGKFVQVLRELPDFCLIQLEPVSGSYVSGFGNAFRLEGDNLRQVTHITAANLDNPPRP